MITGKPPFTQAGSGIGPRSEGRGWVQADSSQAGRLGRVDSYQAGWLGWADFPRWAWVRPGGWVGKAAPRAGLGERRRGRGGGRARWWDLPGGSAGRMGGCGRTPKADLKVCSV